MIGKCKERGFKAGDIVAAYVAVLRGRGVKVSASALQQWRRRHRLDGVAGLVDGRSSRARPSQRCDRFLDEVRKAWRDLSASLDGFHLRSFNARMGLAWGIALGIAERRGWPPQSYRSTRRCSARNCFPSRPTSPAQRRERRRSNGLKKPIE